MVVHLLQMLVKSRLSAGYLIFDRLNNLHLLGDIWKAHQLPVLVLHNLEENPKGILLVFHMLQDHVHNIIQALEIPDLLIVTSIGLKDSFHLSSLFVSYVVVVSPFNVLVYELVDLLLGPCEKSCVEVRLVI